MSARTRPLFRRHTKDWLSATDYLRRLDQASTADTAGSPWCSARLKEAPWVTVLLDYADEKERKVRQRHVDELAERIRMRSHSGDSVATVRIVQDLQNERSFYLDFERGKYLCTIDEAESSWTCRIRASNPPLKGSITFRRGEERWDSSMPELDAIGCILRDCYVPMAWV